MTHKQVFKTLNKQWNKAASVLLRINQSFIMEKWYTVFYLKKILKIKNVYNNHSINQWWLTLQPLPCTYGRPARWGCWQTVSGESFHKDCAVHTSLYCGLLKKAFHIILILAHIIISVTTLIDFNMIIKTRFFN